MRLTLAGLAVGALLLTGCGDDGTTYEGSYEPVDPDSSPSGPSATADPQPVDCTTDAVARFPDVEEIALQGGAAVALGGPAYTIYAGDYEVPTEGMQTNGAFAGPGEHLATVAITVFNAEGELPEIEVGQPIEYTSEFGGLSFIVMLDDEGEMAGNNAGAVGTVTVLALDEDSVCVDVGYRDDEKSVVGTISATIV